MKKPFISVIMPIFNEEKYIQKCLDSLLLQDYPKEAMEWIIVDGMSSDNTRKYIKAYIEKYPVLIKVLDNPNRTVPYAMNIGIRECKGEYVIRIDAHAEYPADYFKKCIFYLQTIDADNVGGVTITKSKSETGKQIAKMLSSRFGVGNSQFRTNGKSGYVDTVPYGAFKRDVFKNWGGYDERLTRNQDNELNYRIRKNGGKVYLASDIQLVYYCRDTVKGICDMARKNGMWNVITMKMCPGSMGIRHFIPLAFVLFLVFFPLLSLWKNTFFLILTIVLSLYLICDFAFSLKIADSIKSFLFLIVLFPCFHISYGFGSILGIVKIFSKKYKNRSFIPEKI